MDDHNSVDATVRGFFLAKVCNGKVPEVIQSNEGVLRYFPIEVNEETYWLTMDGLMLPRLMPPLD